MKMKNEGKQYLRLAVAHRESGNRGLAEFKKYADARNVPPSERKSLLLKAGFTEEQAAEILQTWKLPLPF